MAAFVFSGSFLVQRQALFGGNHVLCTWTRRSLHRRFSAPAFATTRQQQRRRDGPRALANWSSTVYMVPLLLAENEKLYAKLFLGAFGLIGLSFLSALIVGLMARANYAELEKEWKTREDFDDD